MKVLFLVLIVCLIIPATAYSQIADLNKVSASSPTPIQTPVSTQCLDFNQDRICESIVLANGTIIKNPDLPVTEPVINNNTNSNSTVAKPLNSAATGPCSGGVEYRLGTEVFCTPEEYKEASQIQYEQQEEEREEECEQSAACQALFNDEGPGEPWNEPGEGERNDNDEDEDLPQEGGCQEEDDYCDRDENCQSPRVDCIDDRGFDEDDYDG